MSDPTADPVELTITDGLAHLRLRRPRTGNAIDEAMAVAIDDAVAAVHGSAAVRALLISGEGRALCVGGDVQLFGADLGRLPERIEGLVARWHGTTLPRLAELPVPVVTAAQGITGGGALGLLWCADVVVAADDLRLVSGFGRLGLSGDGGTTWHLPRIVGLRRAQQFLLRDVPIDAAEALARGLVSRVVPAAALLDAALGEAAELAAGPTRVHAQVKRLLADSSAATYREQLAAEARAMGESARRPDARRGIEAFLARRRPEFRGD